VNNKNKKVNALLNLLEDDNQRVVSLAMEQLLNIGSERDAIIAEYQEATNPSLRKRIHQLSSIINRRQKQKEFIHAIQHEKIPAWQGVIQLNQLYDKTCNKPFIEISTNKLAKKIKKQSKTITITNIATIMRSEEFSVPTEDNLNTELYLMDKILSSRYSSSICLCVLTRQISSLCNTDLVTVLYNGHYCLIDEHNLLLDPSAGWRISKLNNSENLHPCTDKDILLGILSQLFLSAVLDGQIQEIYYFSNLLSSLNNSTTATLPFPIGNK